LAGSRGAGRSPQQARAESPVPSAARPAPRFPTEPEVIAMKTMMLVLALAFSLVGGCGSGDGDTAEKVFADMTTNMQEMAAILDSVTDETTAKAAVPRIDAVRANMRDCARRARAVPRPDAATEQRLNAAAEAVQRDVMPALMATRQRLEARPELMAILAPALQGMENDL
jgi:hypothetical protein